MTPPPPAETQIRNSQIWLSTLLILAIFALSVATLASVAAIRNAQQSPQQTIRIQQGSESSATVRYNKDDPLLAQRMIFVAGKIDEPTSETIIRHLITLNAANPNRPINLVINSDGGQKTGAFAIIEAMKTIKAPVNTWATGNCASAGAMVLVGGTGKRYATPQAVICVHVNSDPVTEDNKWSIFGVLTPQFEALWRTRAKLPEEWYPLQGEERWYNMTAKQALQYRIVDEIRYLPLN